MTALVMLIHIHKTLLWQLDVDIRLLRWIWVILHRILTGDNTIQLSTQTQTDDQRSWRDILTGHIAVLQVRGCGLQYCYRPVVIIIIIIIIIINVLIIVRLLHKLHCHINAKWSLYIVHEVSQETVRTQLWDSQPVKITRSEVMCSEYVAEKTSPPKNCHCWNRLDNFRHAVTEPWSSSRKWVITDSD